MVMTPILKINTKINRFDLGRPLKLQFSEEIGVAGKLQDPLCLGFPQFFSEEVIFKKILPDILPTK